MTFLLALVLATQVPVEWESFGEGSWSEHLTTGRRDGAAVRITERTMLKEVTAKEIVVGLETVDAKGGTSAVDFRYPLPQREPAKEEEGRKTGSETLTIDGKTYACDILERRGVRRWVCAAVKANRGVLKSETMSEIERITTRLLKVEDKVVVDGKPLNCWVREEITDTGDQKQTRTAWMCDEVPGGTVKLEVRQVRGNDVAVETATILKAFSVVKRK